MNNSQLKTMVAESKSADYEIRETKDESTKDFTIKSYNIAARNDMDAICTSALIKDGEILSTIQLLKDGDSHKIKLSNGKEMPFNGDLTRSGITNVLYTLAGEPDHFEISNFISDDVKNCNIKGMDVEFQKNAIGNTDSVVITPSSIFDRDCSRCGGGGEKGCYCGSWSQNCYC